jgi:hypothetical protein
MAIGDSLTIRNRATGEVTTVGYHQQIPPGIWAGPDGLEVTYQAAAFPNWVTVPPRSQFYFTIEFKPSDSSTGGGENPNPGPAPALKCAVTNTRTGRINFMTNTLYHGCVGALFKCGVNIPDPKKFCSAADKSKGA